MNARPRINTTGPAGLVLWLRRDQPAIYSQLVATVPEVADIERLITENQVAGLGFFAQIGKAIAGFAKNAMPKLIKALPQIASTALDVGSQLYIAKEQKKLIDSQIKQAEAGQAPLQTMQIPQELVQLQNLATGGYLQQPAVVLKPTILPGVPDVATYIGGGVLALVLLKRFGIL